jgi:hypothetical protein
VLRDDQLVTGRHRGDRFAPHVALPTAFETHGVKAFHAIRKTMADPEPLAVRAQRGRCRVRSARLDAPAALRRKIESNEDPALRDTGNEERAAIPRHSEPCRLQRRNRECRCPSALGVKREHAPTRRIGDEEPAAPRIGNHDQRRGRCRSESRHRPRSQLPRGNAPPLAARRRQERRAKRGDTDPQAPIHRAPFGRAITRKPTL